MQMFFLKNLVGVSVAALILGGISIATMAEQQEAVVDPNSSLHGAMMGNQYNAESLPMAPFQGVESLNNGLMTPADQHHGQMVANETNPITTPNNLPVPSDEGTSDEDDTPLERTEERLQALTDVDEDLPEPDDVEPLSAEEESSSEANEPEEAESNSSAESTTPTESEETPSEDNAVKESTVEESNEDNAAPEELSEEENSEREQPSIDEGATPSVSYGRSAQAQPKLIMAPQAWDDERSRPKPQKEDPNDPTGPDNIPDRRGGKRKGAPKLLNPKMIPIIRMGENLQQDSGFTIIKSWDN